MYNYLEPLFSKRGLELFVAVCVASPAIVLIHELVHIFLWSWGGWMAT
jgi:hypothetical protein